MRGLVRDVEGEEPQPRYFVNPEILDPAEELNTYQEGCLSVPDIYADVDRPKACRVRWQDLDGKTQEAEFDGLMSVCLQHEVDHLNGVLFIDYLSRLKRDMVVRKVVKARRERGPRLDDQGNLEVGVIAHEAKDVAAYATETHQPDSDLRHRRSLLVAVPR